MPKLTTGARLRSQVDTTEIIIVKAPTQDLDLRIGGHPAIGPDTQPTPGLVPDPPTAEPTLLGKRYTRDQGDLELLITKAGTTTITIGTTPLTLKESKPLPASD